MTIRRFTGWIAALAICSVLLLTPLCIGVPIMSVAADSSSLPNYADGDLNGDYEIDIFDAMQLYMYTSGSITLPISQLLRADVNGDNVVDIYDAMSLYLHASGITSLQPSAPPAEDDTTVTITTSCSSMGTTVTGTSTTATTGTTALLGIDVSYAQGTIDWVAVSESEIDFVIIRCGYGQDEPDQDDVQWEANVAACEELGIPYGVYFFSYARNAEEAYGEAMHALRLLEGKNPTYPVFYDLEYSDWQGNLTNEEYAQLATVFCDTLASYGYKVGVYSNLDWWRNRLTDECFNRWYRWVAQYNDTCDYTGTYHIWQYSQEGMVDGIDGNTVDMNYSYCDFAALDVKTKESDDGT